MNGKMDKPDQEITLNDVSRTVTSLIDKHIQGTMCRVDFELRSGVSIRSIYKWRNGTHDPKMSYFIAFANTLGYDVIMRRKKR
ncbi:MAG: hypothetical protein JSC189_000048 [Candidatus Tokpelaia sp. JSC189]|nr:MAG: hypothetical protein JSC189_000048 [Candidatus Tokpelaia sp. JSC189]